ncbi:MAG TPA: hypothetical protein VLG74_08800, partial [Blastocatellia bacterium]|nr:hypothetical protein [Blastocatellia bacterium]
TLSWLAFPANLGAQQRTDLPDPSSSQVRALAVDGKYLDGDKRVGHTSHRERTGGGIQEEIPKRYNDRYLEWKKEFLASATGRGQWDTYAHHPRLVLTITMSADQRDGARTDKYEWDDSGGLIAVTITLGPQIDEGYPKPAYYPVLSSVERLKTKLKIGNILAAAKIAHEFDHVNQAYAGGARFRRQTEVAHAYNAILLSNGYDTRDPRLIELSQELGGTPVELSEEREYSSEENSMRYLLDRFKDGDRRRALLGRVKKTIGLYAQNFAERFNQITHSELSASRLAVSTKRSVADRPR